VTVPLPDLLAHRRRALLLEEIESADPQRFVCRARIGDDVAGMRNGTLPGVFALEPMAQAVGAFIALRRAWVGDPRGTGYLVGIRNASIDVDVLAAGDVLEVQATHVSGEEDLGVCDVVATRDGAPVARARMTVYRAPHELGGRE
jgi:predicted hotdog family 3-hydroxylacyl-ACP dehydratase